jgi:hypothetical protein
VVHLASRPTGRNRSKLLSREDGSPETLSSLD